MSIAIRVIKNTGFLYAKMCITVILSLYTTRLILVTLGASDFGIYNVVGGAIVMLGFLNSTMAMATQRFMSFSLGEGNTEKCKQIFNISIVLHVSIAVLTAIILLIAMWPLFHGILNIPIDRMSSARIVYLCLVFSTLFTIINVPYDALLNSHENMLYYSIVGIIESLLRLSIAIICFYSSVDKLILYGVLMTIVPLITLTIMKIYCHKHYKECAFAPIKYWDYSIAREMLVFSGWNILTAVSYLFTANGIGIVLNHFYGTILNTAHGIANQLNGYMTVMSLQLSKAVNPIIVKKAGEGSIDKMNVVTITSCKFTTFLVMFFAVPCIIEISFVLSIWLEKVPEWTKLFCVFQLIQTMITQMVANITASIFAQGKIKYYTIYKSITNILPVFLVYISFKLGGSPVWLYIPMIFIWAIGGDIIVVLCAKKLCGLSIKSFIKEILLPVCGMATFMFTLGNIPSIFLQDGFYKFLCCGLMTTLGFVISLFLFGMNFEEREMLQEILKRNFFIKKIIKN